MTNKDHRFHSAPKLWDKLKPLARQKRHDPTPAEAALWQRLRGRQVQGAKFRRQYTIGPFIVDFVCLEAQVIVEVDGPIHDYTLEEDRIRQDWLESLGFTVLRFTNDEVLQTIGTVLERIAEELLKLSG